MDDKTLDKNCFECGKEVEQGKYAWETDMEKKKTGRVLCDDCFYELRDEEQEGLADGR